MKRLLRWTGILILVVLIGLAFTDWETREQRDNRFQRRSMSKLKAIGNALREYYNYHGRLPPLAMRDDKGNATLSWRVSIIPFMNDLDTVLFSRFHCNEPWDSRHNKAFIRRMPDFYGYDPGNAIADSKGRTCCLAVTGPGTLFDKSERQGTLSAGDMASKKPLIVEVDEDCATIWTKPIDLVFSRGSPIHGLRGRRNGKCLVLLANGDVIAVEGSVLVQRVTTTTQKEK